VATAAVALALLMVEPGRGAAQRFYPDDPLWTDADHVFDASKAVKDQIRLAVVDPLKSGDVRQIGLWIKSVIEYSPENIERRLEYGRGELRQDLVDLRAGAR